MDDKHTGREGRSRKRSSSLLGRGADRGTVNTAIGLVLAVAVVSSAVVASVAVPSSDGASANPRGDVQAVERGLESSLDSTNQQVINKDAQEDDSAKKRVQLALGSRIPDHAWENIPLDTRQLLSSKIGTLLVQIEAQNNVDGELTRVEPAEGGVERGAVLKQHGTGERTITDTVTEQYTDEKRVFSHYERVFDGYDRVFDGWRTVTTGYKQVQVGWETQRTMKQVSYQEAVYETKTVRVRKSRTVADRVRRSSTTREFVCDIAGPALWISPYNDGMICLDGHYETETHTWWETVYRTEYYWDYETKRVFSHYTTKYRLEPAWEQVPVYEKRPITEKRATYDLEPQYDQEPRYKTIELAKTREKEVTKEVRTTPFVIDGEGDWTAAKNISEARDATMRIERTGLTEKSAEAMQLKAVDQSGDSWTLSTYRNGKDIVLQSNAGPTVRIDSEYAKINFEKGTVNGRSIGYHFAEGLDDNYDLKFTNGDNARGTYRVTIAGEPSITARNADVNEDEAGVTVVDGIVYSAEFDVTVETSDSTYSERLTIKPDVVVNSTAETSDDGWNWDFWDRGRTE